MTTYLTDLNETLHTCMERDERVMVIGEDIIDPYGGAFKVTEGLSTAYPDRVFPTPISEAALVGVAAGAAVRGMLPVAEIMFGDFVTLAMDQLVNHVAKFGAEYNGQVQVPLVVRTPMGGGRGYGPTHSQTLEKHLLGIPGLRVVAPSHYHAVGSILLNAILKDRMPVLFIEHKLLYPHVVMTESNGKDCFVGPVVETEGMYPTVGVSNYPSGSRKADVTLVCYGGISRHLGELLSYFRNEEIWIDAIIPSEISRTSYPEIVKSAARTGRVVLVEEGTAGFGWTSEVGVQLAEAGSAGELKVVRVQADESVIPAERSMESEMLPGSQDIAGAIVDLLL